VSKCRVPSGSSREKDMTNKITVLTLCAMLLALCLSAEAQQPAKVARIGVLSGVGDFPSVEAFREGLRELGYVEGENITIEYRSAEGKVDRLPDLAAELVRLKVDVIVGATNPAIVALKQTTQTIPVVMAIVGDPVGAGFIASLAHPGGNISGLSNISEDLSGKRLELLKEVNPRITRVALFWNPTNRTHAVLRKETQAAATVLAIKLSLFDIQVPDAIERAFGKLSREHAEALIVLADPVTFSHQKQIVDLAAKNRLPAMYPWTEFVNSGGLMAYAPNRDDLWRRAATYVDKILKGRKPADLPVEQPTKFEFIVNLKAAKQIGLTIPPNVLARADKVIK
jgi:putative tryptophan/tyrosine transport system substrate-binding protein